MDFTKPIFELIKRTATELPQDIVSAISSMKDKEDQQSTACSVLGTILENIELSKTQQTPICQDTGMLYFIIYYPTGYSTLEIKKGIIEATKEVTKQSILRPNAVDTVSGKNSGDNIGVGAPTTYFYEWDKDYFEIRLMLKGGGSENVGTQYKLPDSALGAGRDLNGVKKCVLDAVHKAQGLGCAPGILGVGIGGDRGGSYYLSKTQFFRKLDDANPDRELDKLEKDLFESANQLGIGPMGFGGNTTVLGAKVGAYHRHPATYYVTVSYLCWASRRKIMTLRTDGGYDID